MSEGPKHISISLAEGKSVFFASDFHLGAPDSAESRIREKKIIRWLDEIYPATAALFLVGDLFDFWFEYKKAVPKGFTRFMSAVARFTDNGIPVYVFTGNHDIWMFDYLEDELGVQILKSPAIFSIGSKTFFVGHGDGLGPGDSKFKLLKKVFTFPPFQWMFKWVHPDIGISIAQSWSDHSRTDPATERFMGKERERLYIYAEQISGKLRADFYIFGHRHLPLDLPLEQGGRYINLGDWLYNYTYLEFDGKNAFLKKFSDHA